MPALLILQLMLSRICYKFILMDDFEFVAFSFDALVVVGVGDLHNFDPLGLLSLAPSPR